MARYLMTTPEAAEAAAQWAARRIPHFELGRSPYGAIGMCDEHGRILCAAVYDDSRGHDICMHVAAEGRNWLNRDFLREGFRYPFLYLGCDRVTGLVRASNLAAQKFDEHLGFKLEGYIRRGCAGGEDLLIYGMLREECRWLDVGKPRMRSTIKVRARA